MAKKAKRPSVRLGDAVVLSPIKSVIPSYDGKPFVGRESVLRVSSITGTGSARNPWGVVVTDGQYFWHLEGDDVVRAEEGSVSGASGVRGGKAKMEREIQAVVGRTIVQGGSGE